MIFTFDLYETLLKALQDHYYTCQANKGVG